MTYKRVIPRDLFNESNLLKCLGRLYFELARHKSEDMLVHEAVDEPFMIKQDRGDGAIYVDNVYIVARGRMYKFYRPLNSREEWPIYVIDQNEEEIAVYDDNGHFTGVFLNFIKL